ncbi:DUF3823 domain-containing protein [Massilibacteroides vaginae]|uniref:DUF3823 domain-containing protein n=1 Tax=Massilibacteroides vaginae TaxID=1673718 RepID=UPI000A1CAE92|nr:DUF3823 domain-containing protein [Massilibacteroides vaginae]
MKKNKLYIAFLSFSVFFASCGLTDIDNYDAPNATIQGGIYDMESNELIEQDIVDGMQIEFVEQGFDNPHTQYMIVKNDGTYQNNLMFAASYTMQPVRGNFVPVEKQDITVKKGNNTVDFKVQPYIRIKNAEISKVGNKVVATFKIEQTVTNDVKQLTLFAHQEPNVGWKLHTASANQDVNTTTLGSTLYTLEIDLAANSSLQSGKEYYFRVGALIDAPEAKYNYAPAVRLKL